MTDRGTREPGGVGGLTGSGGDEGAGSHGGAAGSQDRGGVWASEAEGRVEGSSRLNANGAGDRQTSGEPTPQMVSWGWAERLTKSSEDGVEKGNRSMRGGGRGRLGGISCQSNSSDEGWVKCISVSKSINSSESSVSSPSAVAPWAELSIAPAISTAVSILACAVDTWGSGSGAIVSSVAPDGDGSTTVAGSGSPSAVGSGSSAPWGGNWLGSGSRVELVSSSAMSTVSFDECGEALSRTVPGQLRSCGGVQSSLIKRAEAVVRVVRVIRQEHEVLGVVLERTVPLLQQEDEDSRIIHNKKQKRKTKRGETRCYTFPFRLVNLSRFLCCAHKRVTRRWRVKRIIHLI